jgi:hypothetical protein
MSRKLSEERNALKFPSLNQRLVYVKIFSKIVFLGLSATKKRSLVLTNLIIMCHEVFNHPTFPTWVFY